MVPSELLDLETAARLESCSQRPTKKTVQLELRDRGVKLRDVPEWMRTGRYSLHSIDRCLGTVDIEDHVEADRRVLSSLFGPSTDVSFAEERRLRVPRSKGCL